MRIYLTHEGDHEDEMTAYDVDAMRVNTPVCIGVEYSQLVIREAPEVDEVEPGA